MYRAWVQSKANPYVTYGGLIFTGTGISPLVSFPHVNIFASMYCSHSFVYHRRYVTAAIDSVSKTHCIGPAPVQVCATDHALAYLSNKTMEV